MVDRQIFAYRLRELRTNHGLSQPQLAKELGMIKQRVNNWESGLSLPSADVLADLANYFTVSTDYLLGLSDDATPHMTLSASMRDTMDFKLVKTEERKANDPARR